MARVGHYVNHRGRSAFRIFAPLVKSLSVLLADGSQRIPLAPDDIGYWTGETSRLPAGTLYWLEMNGQTTGRRLPDPASRRQPLGVHGPSMVVDVEPARSPGWAGVKIDDAIVYELHLGTFTPEGTLAAASGKLPYLADLGINVIELLPISAFPGERNWGYDGTYPFALHAGYGDYGELKTFIESAHALGMAVILDVVYNHFGPEGHYGGALAPYTQAAATPWGAAINFDREYNHGVREFFLENTRYWLKEVGFDGFRMDAVSMIFDNTPVHILRQITGLARQIGRDAGREVLMIAEHLRNNRFVTSKQGFGFHAQWNDDLNHALFAFLTGERHRHCANFGSFDDVVKALQRGFVLDGMRFDKLHRCFPGTDGRKTKAIEHVVHIQNHDQVGNRLLGDRMIATYGEAKALLAITAVMASPYVPMLFMGEEYGETAPFLFHEDFSDQAVIDGARDGRRADLAFGGLEPQDPHDRATFEASKLQWHRVDSAQGQRILNYYRRLIALKRSGQLGPRHRADVRVTADAVQEIIRIETPRTLTVMNFSGQRRSWQTPTGWTPALCSVTATGDGVLEPFCAMVLERC